MQRNAVDFGGLALRIGVNTGELMFAPVGPDQQRQQTVIGDVVNIASRLQTSAPRDGILVGEETWRATRRAIRYEEVEPFIVKGKDAPLDAWLALEAVAATATERPLSDVPMVGRDRELQLLVQTWERAVEGECMTVLVCARRRGWFAAYPLLMAEAAPSRRASSLALEPEHPV